MPIFKFYLDIVPLLQIASRKHMYSVDVMRVPIDICPEAMLEHSENLSDTGRNNLENMR
jgi:hypothetical protein